MLLKTVAVNLSGNNSGEEATIGVPLEQQATSLEEQINTDDNNFNLNEKNEREKFYKERQRKSKNLENIIKTISSPVKKGILKNLIQRNSRAVNETYTHNDSVCEARMCQALLNELKQLNQSKKYSKFHERLHELFGD